MIIKLRSGDKRANAWDQALYDLDFMTFDRWCSNGVTAVEIQTGEESDVPTLAIYKDGEETFDYPPCRRISQDVPPV
jgi:hypothetical protein